MPFDRSHAEDASSSERCLEQPSHFVISEGAAVMSPVNGDIQHLQVDERISTKSDRGVQYASEHYQTLLREHGITCSMSRKGNYWDNAPMKIFFTTLKKELVHHERYRTRAAARQSLFEYIEVLYNRQRRHSALSYQTSVQFAEVGIT